METMHKVKAGLMRVLGIIIIALFVFMTLIGSYQIVTRYFFNRPSTVSEELLTFLLAAVVMVYGGASITKLTMIQKTASLQVPMAYIYVIVPVTGVLIMLFSIMNAIDVAHMDFKEKGDVRL